jgi:hypothetical protein
MALINCPECEKEISDLHRKFEGYWEESYMKKIFAVGFAIMLAIILVACGGESASKSKVAAITPKDIYVDGSFFSVPPNEFMTCVLNQINRISDYSDIIITEDTNKLLGNVISKIYAFEKDNIYFDTRIDITNEHKRSDLSRFSKITIYGGNDNDDATLAFRLAIIIVCILQEETESLDFDKYQEELNRWIETVNKTGISGDISRSSTSQIEGVKFYIGSNGYYTFEIE